MSGILDYNVCLPLLDFNDFIQILIRVDTGFSEPRELGSLPSLLSALIIGLYAVHCWSLRTCHRIKNEIPNAITSSLLMLWEKQTETLKMTGKYYYTIKKH